MSDKSESINDTDRVLHGDLCLNCGEIVEFDSACPNCGAAAVSSDGIQLSVNLTVVFCDQCGTEASCGVTKCSACGETLEYIDPLEGPTNKAKLESLGDLLPEFERLASVSSAVTMDRVKVTDQQLIEFINRNQILSTTLIDQVKSVASRIDISTNESIRSSATRHSFEELLGYLSKTRDTFNELESTEVHDQFRELHSLLKAAFQALLELHLWVARAVLATTIEDTRRAHRELQSALDRAADAARSMSVELGKGDPERMRDTFNRRLSLFTGIPGSYEHRELPDFAAAIARGLGDSQWVSGLPLLAESAGGFVHRMLAVDPSELPPEHGLSLYVLAAQFASSDDPLSLRRRTAVYLQILEDAYANDSAKTLEMVQAAWDDQVEALVTTLAIGDNFQALAVDSLSREGMRLKLIETNTTLTEAVFRRLISLLLGASFIIGGKPRPYSRLSAQDFGGKLKTLSQLAANSDERFAVALAGLSSVARNAGAHGGVTLSGDKLLLRQVKNSKVTGEEHISDEDFCSRLLDLFLTCQALTSATEVFRINHHDELPIPPLRTEPRLLAEIARILVGLGKLYKANVSLNDDTKTVSVRAQPIQSKPGHNPQDYLSTAVALAILFHHWTSIELNIVDDKGDRLAKISLPTNVAMWYQELPDHGRVVGTL